MLDIKLKHPAATIDTQIDRVISGAVVTDNTDSVVTPEGKKPVSGEGVSKALNEGIAAGLAGLMPATPSGDPMHYAYVAAGAVWDATTGFWKLNTLTDITTEQMRAIYNFGFLRLELGALAGTASQVRTNLIRVGTYNPIIQTFTYFAYENRVIEVIMLNNGYGNYEALVTAAKFDNWFFNCASLSAIYGRLRASSSGVVFNNCFAGCAKLSRVRLYRLAQNVSFADSPLDKESLLYMINESAATSPIVITLHADVYAWASTDSDVQTALAAKPNVTIASA